MGSRADVEDAIFGLKDSGMSRMPFTDWHANSAWAAIAAVSLTLVGWFQACCLSGTLSKAALKRLRWQLWHLPAIVSRTARRVLGRLPEQRPGTEALLAIAHPAEPPRDPNSTVPAPAGWLRRARTHAPQHPHAQTGAISCPVEPRPAPQQPGHDNSG